MHKTNEPNLLPYLKKEIILDHWQSSHQVIFNNNYFSTLSLPRTIMLTLVILNCKLILVTAFKFAITGQDLN